MQMLKFLLIAALTFASVIAEARPRGQGGVSLHNGRLVQINAADANGSPEQFLNLFKGAGRWRNVSAGGAFDLTRLDADGYPTSLPVGGVETPIFIPSSSAISEYILMWDGNGTMGSTGGLVSGSYSTSGAIISFGASSTPSTVYIRVLAVNSSSDYPHNIRLVANNGRDAALLAAGQVFRPEYLAYIGAAGAVRTMDFVSANVNTQVFWADRKPVSYYTYNNHYFPPGKIVPIANVTYDGVSKYNVTWSGQTGPLTDKTQMIAQVPTTQTALPSTLNLNSTGDITLKQKQGQAITSGIVAGRWMLFTYDETLAAWLVDDSAGSNLTGIQNGAPPEILVRLANDARVHLWHVPGAYQCDVGDNTISDYIPELAAFTRDNLNPNLQAWYEVGPNELWNFAQYPTVYAWEKQKVRNGGSAYTVTGATSGTTTTLTIGANTTQVGSLLSLSGIGGLTLSSNNARVLSKPSSTQIEVSPSSTGTYTSGGTATPNAFDNDNWYGVVGQNIGQAIATVYGIDQKGIRYRTIAGFQTYNTVNALNSSVGQATKLTSPFWTARGETPSSDWLTDISPASYYSPGFVASNGQMTIKLGQLAFEYTTASAGRQEAILDELQNSSTLSTTPVTITNITPGNPTVVTVDRTDLFMTRDINGSDTSTREVTSLTGVTGTMAATLNRTTYNSPNFQILSKTGNTVTLNVNTTGLTYTGGGQMTTRSSINISMTHLYANALPQFLTYASTYSLGVKAYEGGSATDGMTADSWATIKGITNGATTVIDVGANVWDYLYNTVGLSGMTTTISPAGITGQTPIAAGTLATHLNGNSYTILSATATTITIDVDTSADSTWVSGGTAQYDGSRTAANVILALNNFTPATQTNTVLNYQNWAALCAACNFPSEFILVGIPNYSMVYPALLGQTRTPYRMLGMQSYNFLLKRDLDPASNDNDPMWLEKAA